MRRRDSVHGNRACAARTAILSALWMAKLCNCNGPNANAFDSRERNSQFRVAKFKWRAEKRNPSVSRENVSEINFRGFASHSNVIQIKEECTNGCTQAFRMVHSIWTDGLDFDFKRTCIKLIFSMRALQQTRTS